MSKSAEFWNKQAEKYSKSAIADQEAYERKLQETQNLFTADMHVLEFGCGTGTTAVHHASRVKHIDALDISENMLAIGRQRSAEAGADNIDFKKSTLLQFDTEPASYDVVLGLSILHLLPDRAATVDKVVELLKPGGFFVSSTACLGDSLIRYIKLITPLAKMVGLMPDVYILKEKQLLEELTNAGLIISSQWHHGGSVNVAFIVASKPG